MLWEQATAFLCCPLLCTKAIKYRQNTVAEKNKVLIINHVITPPPLLSLVRTHTLGHASIDVCVYIHVRLHNEWMGWTTRQMEWRVLSVKPAANCCFVYCTTSVRSWRSVSVDLMKSVGRSCLLYNYWSDANGLDSTICKLIPRWNTCCTYLGSADVRPGAGHAARALALQAGDSATGGIACDTSQD